MTEQQKKLSRRDALKILGAAAGASVLANLPSKWSTPELASGVLPAHAQVSGLTFLDGGFINTIYPTRGKFYPNERSGNLEEISRASIDMCAAMATHWVQISLPIANIPLGLVTSSTYPVTWYIPNNTPPDGTYYTDSNGKVEIPFGVKHVGGDHIDFAWKFINLSDGTDTKTFVFSACASANSNNL